LGLGLNFSPEDLLAISDKYSLQVRVEDLDLVLQPSATKPTDQRRDGDRRRTTHGYTGPERRSDPDRRMTA
jgi:hypothetical protein